jgi:DMSO reductase iron-sulfur subunit
VAFHRLFVDHELCFGCYACEVACKQENNLPVGAKWIRVITEGPSYVNGKLSMSYIPMTCRHCTNAPCISACPQDAITRRQDGIVTINAESCIGCLECLSACPFGAPQFNSERDIVEKCNLCVDRVEKGLAPACAQACPAGAIYYGDINEITEKVRQRKAGFLVGNS